MLITQIMLLMSGVGVMVGQHERGLGKEYIYYRVFGNEGYTESGSILINF